MRVNGRLYEPNQSARTIRQLADFTFGLSALAPRRARLRKSVRARNEQYERRGLIE